MPQFIKRGKIVSEPATNRWFFFVSLLVCCSRCSLWWSLLLNLKTILTTTLTRTLNWISRQVAPTWKVLQQIDSTNGTSYLKDILDHAKLTERHRKLIEQQTTSTEEIIKQEE